MYQNNLVTKATAKVSAGKVVQIDGKRKLVIETSPPPPAKKSKVATTIRKVTKKKKTKIKKETADSFTNASNISVQESSNWVEPDYSNTQWFDKNCHHCHFCKKDFIKISDASKCVQSHKALRCSLCFLVLEDCKNDNKTKRLFEHYQLRHKPGNKSNTIECPYCSDIICYEDVSDHMFDHILLSYNSGLSTIRNLTESPSFPKPHTPPRPPPPVSPEAAQFLREIISNNLDSSAATEEFSDAFLNSGIITAEILPKCLEEYKLIQTYVKNGQAHNFFGVQLLEVIRLSRKDDLDRTPVPSHENKKVMLWHGTKYFSVRTILEHGFILPPYGMQMFGQGIYFADRISKSAQYCPEPPAVPTADMEGYIFLCEVQLGRVYNAKNPVNTYKGPPNITRTNGEVLPCDSLMCTGQNIPDATAQIMKDGVVWCVGRTVQNTRYPSYTTLYNEFIVYDPKRITIKYLVKVRFTATHYLDYEEDN